LIDWIKAHLGWQTEIVPKPKNEKPWVLIDGKPVQLILPRICGREKVSDILFPKEGKDHAEGAKDLYPRV
jgi:hypothetical protein